MLPALEVAKLTRRFGRTVALDGITLTLDAGAAVALFGPNGAGKTTFMRACATVLRPSSGSVRVFGHDVVTQGSKVRRRIGMLSHESYLYPDLTPTENLLFYARLFRVPNPAVRVEELIERMDLIGWAHRPVRTLSRGLLQRSALARVLLHQPELLFLDEPYTGLDIEATAALRSVLSEVNRAGTTLLMSTHDLVRGFELCTSAIILVRGRLAWHGPITPADQSRFENDYLLLTRRPKSDGFPAAAAAPSP